MNINISLIRLIKLYLIISCLVNYNEIIVKYFFNIITNFNRLLIKMLLCELFKYRNNFTSIINLIFILISFNIYPSKNNYYIYYQMFIYMYEKIYTTLKYNIFYKYLMFYQYLIILINFIMFLNKNNEKNKILNVIFINNFAIAYIADFIETF
jgi:hypothetical protein